MHTGISVRGAALAALAALLLAGGGASAQTIPDGTSLLRWSADGHPRLPMEGQQTVILWRENGSDVQVADVQRSGHGQTRSEVIMPRSQRGRILLEDRRQRWSYDPKTRRAVRTTAEAGDDGQTDFDALERNYRVEVAPQQERVAGRAAWVITTRGDAPGKPWRRVWLDEGNGFALRVEKHHADGGRESVSEYRTIRFPNSLPASLFKLPAGARVEPAGEVETPASLQTVHDALGVSPASELPEGYRLRSAAVVGAEPDAVYHLRYDDGLSIVSLFLSRSRDQLPQSGNAERIALTRGSAHLHRNSHLLVLSWSRGPTHCAVVGDVSQSLLAQLADATGCAANAAAREPGSPLTDLWVLVPALATAFGLAVCAVFFFLGRRQRLLA